MSSFRKGVHPHDCKEMTSQKSIEKLISGEAAKVFIPISQFAGEKSDVLVQAGDVVTCGQCIAKATGKFGVDIHASISGTVVGVQKEITAVGSYVDCIVIEKNDDSGYIFMENIKSEESSDVITRIKEAGIIGMGGASFPTHFKLQVPADKVVDFLLINAAECEPYINCDNRLMIEQSIKCVEGARIVAKAVGVKKIVIGVEENKAEAIEALLTVPNTSSDIKDVESKVIILKLKTKYPQGAEKILIKAITSREVPTGKLPADVGCVVVNLHTTYQVFLAVRENRPLTERVVTVSGGALENPSNFIVPIGTLYEDLFAATKGDMDTVCEIISGGSMMGFTVFSTRIPVAKGTSSILFLTEKEIAKESSSVCINCGKCASVCPLKLMPMYMDSYSIEGDFETANKYGIMKCMECGCCSFACPAKRPLVQSIRLAKKALRKKGAR